MKNTKRDDIAFLINTFGVTLIIVAILVVFQPYLENEQMLPEIKRLESQMQSITPEELMKKVDLEYKPVMLVAYASWCSYCRATMPVIVDLVREKQLGDIVPIFVSLDEEPRKFSKYVVRSQFSQVITPYVLDYGLSNPIANAMEKSGSRFTGVIPYIGFFDRNGKVVVEANGAVNADQLLFMARKVQTKE